MIKDHCAFRGGKNRADFHKSRFGYSLFFLHEILALSPWTFSSWSADKKAKRATDMPMLKKKFAMDIKKLKQEKGLGFCQSDKKLHLKPQTTG